MPTPALVRDHGVFAPGVVALPLGVPRGHTLMVASLFQLIGQPGGAGWSFGVRSGSTGNLTWQVGGAGTVFFPVVSGVASGPVGSGLIPAPIPPGGAIYLTSGPTTGPAREVALYEWSGLVPATANPLQNAGVAQLPDRNGDPLIAGFSDWFDRPQPDPPVLNGLTLDRLPCLLLAGVSFPALVPFTVDPQWLPLTPVHYGAAVLYLYYQVTTEINPEPFRIIQSPRADHLSLFQLAYRHAVAKSRDSCHVRHDGKHYQVVAEDDALAVRRSDPPRSDREPFRDRIVIEGASGCVSPFFHSYRGLIEGTYVRGGRPRLARSLDGGESWKTVDIPGSYAKNTSAPYNGGLAHLGTKPNPAGGDGFLWYARFGKPRFDFPNYTYDWSDEVYTGISNSGDSGHLIVDGDGFLHLSWVDVDGVPQLRRCLDFDADAHGTWI